MKEGYPTETRIFTITGEGAPDKMQRLIAYASRLGGVAVSEVGGSPRYLETGPQSAADHLFTLLNEPGPYREKWMARVDGNPVFHDFSQAAVARVIVDWLPTSGHKFESAPPTAVQLKHRISRAFKGKVFTLDLLNWFIGAFQFSDEDREQLIETYINTNEARAATIRSRRASSE